MSYGKDVVFLVQRMVTAPRHHFLTFGRGAGRKDFHPPAGVRPVEALIRPKASNLELYQF